MIFYSGPLIWCLIHPYDNVLLTLMMSRIWSERDLLPSFKFLSIGSAPYASPLSVYSLLVYDHGGRVCGFTPVESHIDNTALGLGERGDVDRCWLPDDWSLWDSESELEFVALSSLELQIYNGSYLTQWTTNSACVVLQF